MQHINQIEIDKLLQKKITNVMDTDGKPNSQLGR